MSNIETEVHHKKTMTYFREYQIDHEKYKNVLTIVLAQQGELRCVNKYSY